MSYSSDLPLKDMVLKTEEEYKQEIILDKLGWLLKQGVHSQL